MGIRYLYYMYNNCKCRVVVNSWFSSWWCVMTNNDKLYCLNCKKIFIDTMRKYKWYKMQDTKLEDSSCSNYKNMCPYCLSRNTRNVSDIINTGDSMLSRDKFESMRNWNNAKFYRYIKGLMK